MSHETYPFEAPKCLKSLLTYQLHSQPQESQDAYQISHAKLMYLKNISSYIQNQYLKNSMLHIKKKNKREYN